jgi:hypothetical protein
MSRTSEGAALRQSFDKAAKKTGQVLDLPYLFPLKTSGEL